MRSAPTPQSRGRWHGWWHGLPALPRSHFMGLAPLDVWTGMLARGGAWKRIPPRFWVRLAWCLFTSALATLLTMPERIAFAAYWKVHAGRNAQPTSEKDGSPPNPKPVQIVCILGYFRSGTTHLHYLLSCDPGTVTPRWVECLAPQGWWVSWALLRWFLVPFLGSTRPQDDVAIGPEWPAEDDFALCNWSLSSSLPGRMVLPREWKAPRVGRASGPTPKPGTAWKQMHALDGVGEKELARWRTHVRAFAAKVAMRSRGGPPRVILKNPSHTARVRELVRAFGVDNIRFIHIARRPEQVVRSNLALHRRFEPFLLQDLPGEDELRRRIVEEYTATEQKFLAEASELPAGRLARVRYQDLIADPIGELRRIYADLGWSWTDALEQRFAHYLREVADYRAAGEAVAGEAHRAEPDQPIPELAWMLERFDHARPPPPRDHAATTAPHTPAAPSSANTASPVLDPLIVTLLVATLWLAAAFALGTRPDWLTWPAGVVIGLSALRSAASRGGGGVGQSGSHLRGLYAAALTAGALAIIAYPATSLAFYKGITPIPWRFVWDSTRDGLLAVNNLIWIFLGVMTAYRLASRKHVNPPGQGARPGL